MADTKKKFYHIMEILMETDEDHPKTAVQIADLLETRYGIRAERKSIYRDIDVLRSDCGMDIFRPNDRREGWYLASRTFEEWELKFLIDLALSSNVLPKKEVQGIVKKLKAQASPFGRELLEAISPSRIGAAEDHRHVKNNIDTILRAIRMNRKITFRYMRYDVNGRRVPRNDHVYRGSPYALTYKDDFYYMIFHHDGKDGLSHYRIDRMARVEIPEPPERRTPLRDFVGVRETDGLSAFVHRAIYCYGGKDISLRLKCPNYEIDDLIDHFGRAVRIREIPDTDYCEATVSVQDGAGLYYWLMQRADNLEVIAPQSVREKLIKKLRETLAQYEKKDIESM
ncbi:helix-turn-helix transcriptional regulator [Selenomonas artemidis]|uniref:helix-turn-helix transcriptional regulator n=1 Tax=Selenomonas artemidis TaxID=671224 RepID=UPI0023F13E84|nr:WYL domain-containing protein [Selenomonas artemidis]